MFKKSGIVGNGSITGAGTIVRVTEILETEGNNQVSLSRMGMKKMLGSKRKIQVFFPVTTFTERKDHKVINVIK